MSEFAGAGAEIGGIYPMPRPDTAPPVEEHLPPREWLKKNLFSNLFNSILTVVAGLLILVMLRGLLGFIFSPLRQWNATAVNARLLMTHAYPADQYIRVWFSVAAFLILAGLSLAVWRAGSRVPVPDVGKRVTALGVFVTLATLLAPFSGSARLSWLGVAVFLLASGVAVSRTSKDRSVSSLSLLVGVCGLAALSLWVIPYGNHSFIIDRTPKILAEPGTVALTTKLPWTIMLIIAVAAYGAGLLLRDRVAANVARTSLILAWMVTPILLLFLVLRDPDFDMGHVLSTDIPIFVVFAVLGSALLLWLTNPETGEVGRIVAATVLLLAFGSFLTPMRMVIRIFMLLLAMFALAGPTFSGDRQTRHRYAAIWTGVAAFVSWLVTAINTPSTVPVPGQFFLGGFSMTLMVAFFTLLVSFPLGVMLALARTSNMPIFRLLATWFIEFVRGVPLITVLIFFSVMVPLFLPDGMGLSEVAAVTIGYALFASAYLAENVRGGIQSVTRGQHEAAEAVGMTTSQKTVFIVLPQALRVAIPPLVGQVIGTFKETSLMIIIGLFDLLFVAKAIIPNQTEFMGSTRENLLAISIIYWVISYSMSKASQRIEQRVGLGEQ